MNFNIVHILVIVFISGVIGLNNTKLSPQNDVDPIIINGKNASDVPAVTTVNSANVTTVAPTITPPEPTTTPSPNTTTTTPSPNTTTTTPVTTTDKPTTTTSSPNTTTTTSTIAPPTNVTTTTESTTTTAATTTTTAVPAHKGRHFDGPSFIGGIILASGLMAIGFVSWKFYKARTERNYHTL